MASPDRGVCEPRCPVTLNYTRVTSDSDGNETRFERTVNFQALLAYAIKAGIVKDASELDGQKMTDAMERFIESEPDNA